MIASDHDRRREPPLPHHPVEAQAEARALAVSEPADARRQSLEPDVLPRQWNPAMEPRVVGELFQRRGVGGVDVLRLARERGPAERALADAEQRADVLRDEPRIRERLFVRQSTHLGLAA